MTDAKHRLYGFMTVSSSSGRPGSVYLAAGAGPPWCSCTASAEWPRTGGDRARAGPEHRVLVPELPGHGGSEPAAGGADLDPYADAVLAVLEAEEIAGAVWVGHSLGGLVGLRAAIRRPEAVTGIVLAAAAGISSALPVGRAS